MSLAAALLLTALNCAVAPPVQSTAPITGAWAGWVVATHDGKTEEHYLHAVFKQDADALTGTAGADADNQLPIRKGKLGKKKDVLVISFEVTITGVHLAVTLELVDGRLKGDARMEGEDGVVMTAAVELKPVK